MSQPPATPYGPPHDSSIPPQQPGQPGQPPQPGQPQQPGQPGQPQQPGGWPPPQQQGFPPAQPGQPYLPGGPPPAKKSNVGKIVLIVLAVVLVLCLGGVAITWFAVKDDVGDVVDATKTRVVAPETLAGRPKLTDPQLQAAADDLVTQMKSEVQNETSTIGAFYGDPTKQDLVMIAAVSGLMTDPKKELEDAVTGLSTELSVTNMAVVEAGPLGGDARCGDGKAAGDVPLGICVWSDRGSLGMVVIYFKTAEQVKAEFATIRGQVEQRS
ncbi:hypothetical protein [Micromonospora parathelypteridis]|uniref:Flagellar basal body-associated protein FliL n=1 Tax=Micromonospora parathelypteridis TaxID=1839617 RepID=A0A840W9Z2_9ACTN|nr:hypothetical protein [Micromonospora parathelypteridis]MBB5479841.1 flagellar basal body-associated protein FliL [Micromonospora parathelypteridis]GGO26271.1 hypothetical protein GCM10011576_49730 [Micromonospora parathelypteridis]